MPPTVDDTTGTGRAAAALLQAREHRTAVHPFTDADAELDEAWGYDVQALDRQQRLSTGERILGAKLGLTSAAKQARMGIDRPIAGFLTASMLVTPDSLAGRMPQLIQPRIEPEIAFTTARPISGPLDLDGALGVIAGVAVAAEVIDSRFEGYRFRLADVIADNTSAAGVLLGPPQPLTDPDALTAAKCAVRIDGQLAHEATGAAILGNPLLALVWLSEHLAARGETLPAGSLVLAGALTDAAPLTVDTSYDLEIEGLGTISVAT